jgi:hypothetical protein
MLLRNMSLYGLSVHISSNSLSLEIIRVCIITVVVLWNTRKFIIVKFFVQRLAVLISLSLQINSVVVSEIRHWTMQYIYELILSNAIISVQFMLRKIWERKYTFNNSCWGEVSSMKMFVCKISVTFLALGMYAQEMGTMSM